MEFKVRTNKLKGSANNIRSSWLGLRGARWEIESVMRNLDLGKSTGDIRDSLRKSRDKISFLETASSKARSNLEAIATQYEITEKAIKNQRGKRQSIADIIAKAAIGWGAIATAPWKRWFNKGKQWFKNYAGDPVAVDSGNFILDETDLSIGMEEPFEFARFYNSQERDTGSLGHGWIHNFDVSMRVTPERATVVLGDGSEEAFTKTKDGYLAVAGTAALKTAGDTYRYTTLEDETYIFDSQGCFIRSEEANGYGYSLEYEDGRLVKVQRDNGDSFAFTYSEADPDRLASVTDHSGRTVCYEYEGHCLTSVTSGDRVLRYEYDRSGRLSDVIDGRGVTFVHNEYDDEDRVIRQFFADGSEMRYTYDEENAATVVTEKDESESYHFHDSLFRNTENVYQNGSESFEYDANNQVTSETDRNDNETKYWYDDKGNVSRIKRADGTEINFTYEKHNRPVSISVNGIRKIKNVYDSKGNLIESTDALGRRTSYKYNDRGFLTEQRDPSGRVTEFTYDDRDNPVSIDENGNVTRYEYDELNRAVASTDAKGNVTRFEYDRFNHLNTVINASGNKYRYKFNSIDKIESVEDYNGAITHIEYNDLGFPVRETDPLGRVTEDEYDKMWHLVSRKMPNGGVVKIENDSEGRPVKIIDPLGNETIYAYDGNGNMILQVEPEGAITECRYDSFDNLIGVTDPEGNETVYSYDACNNLVYIRNANGGEVHMEYDAADQLIRETNALGQSREYMYTPDGDVCRVIDEAGRITILEYALPGKPSRITFPDGREELYTYDKNGNLETRANKQGRKTTYRYDELDRVVEVYSNDGEHTVYTYDAVGNLTSATDAKGNTVRYEYTLTGQISCVIDELGNRTEYTYDELDLLTEFRRYDQDGSVQKTSYRRDLAGNVVETIDPLGFVEKFAYNGRGELVQKTDKDGYLTKYGYDRKGELNYIGYNDGKEVFMTHDSLGKLAELRDWTGVTKVESDILGRVTKVTYPDNRTAEYTYGKTGERTSIKHPDGRVIEYGYDKAMRLSTLKEGETSIEYGYDEAGRLVSKLFASGLATKYAYDTRDQITELTATRGGDILESVKVGYDELGNRVFADRMRAGLPQESGRFEYGYDQAGRLTFVRKDGHSLREYSYDAFGNRTALISNGRKTEYTYDAMNRLLGTSGALNESFRYDKRGNVIERSVNGAVTNTYEYDPSGSMSFARSGDSVASYEYNGLGHRIEDRIKQGIEPERRIQYTVDMTKYYNNLLERNVDGAEEAYIFDGIAAAVKGRESYEIVADEMGSPVRLLGMDGSNAETYGYDEFGVSLHEEGDLQPLRYAGYRKDPVADMYFVQAREYMPEHGRFAAQDKIKGNAVNPHTANNYIYCGGMPFVYYDPDGMLWHVVVGAAIGGIVGGGFELGKQIIKAKVKGEPVNINWKKVGTAALGGAVEGGLLSAGCPPVAAAGISGFVEGTAEAYIVDGKSGKESLIEGVKAGAIGAAFAGAGELFKKTGIGKKIGKLTSNKWADDYGRKMGLAWKVRKRYTYHPSGKTVARAIVGLTAKKFQKYLKPSTWIKKLVTGKWNPICYVRNGIANPRTLIDAM